MRLTEEEYAALMRGRAPKLPSHPSHPSQPQRKYRNKPTVVNGEQFDSAKEAHRYQELLLQQAAGVITQLRHHVTYPITVNGIDICSYEVDFVYLDSAGARVYEDVKSEATKSMQLFRIKQRLMLAVHGIKVEVFE